MIRRQRQTLTLLLEVFLTVTPAPWQIIHFNNHRIYILGLVNISQSVESIVR